MKNIFNQTALKKAANKKPLLFNYSEDNSVIIWNVSGTFVIKCNKLLFELELQNTLPTEQKEIPSCIPETFTAFQDSNILSETFLTIELDNVTARIYQNYKYKYLTIINIELLKILNDSVKYTPYEFKENRAVLFKNGDINCILFPLYNRGIAEKIQTLAEELKK